MTAPKPQPPVKKSAAEIVEALVVKSTIKKAPFIPKAHLTQRIGQDNPQLAALRDSLPQSKRQNHKISPKAKKQR